MCGERHRVFLEYLMLLHLVTVCSQQLRPMWRPLVLISATQSAAG